METERRFELCILFLCQHKFANPVSAETLRAESVDIGLGDFFQPSS
uniref:Uncharacterized protein n=1 Tax=Fagus sylvatica TaxID=28930 RepID=A0A2N9IVU1_FAGSY